MLAIKQLIDAEMGFRRSALFIRIRVYKVIWFLLMPRYVFVLPQTRTGFYDWQNITQEPDERESVGIVQQKMAE